MSRTDPSNILTRAVSSKNRLRNAITSGKSRSNQHARPLSNLVERVLKPAPNSTTVPVGCSLRNCRTHSSMHPRRHHHSRHGPVGVAPWGDTDRRPYHRLRGVVSSTEAFLAPTAPNSTED